MAKYGHHSMVRLNSKYTILLCIALILICLIVSVENASMDQLTYIGYDLTFQCSERTALRWEYTLGENHHVASRPKSFYFDPKYSRECQQYTTKAYGLASGYDRGHLVASEHMANSDEERHESHYMTNITPQISSFNQGIWKETESIEACYRTLNGGIKTWGGVKYNESDNDIFVNDWGIKTPDYWWKVILAKDNNGNDKIISWFFPNRKDLGILDKYLTSVSAIEEQLNDNIGSIPIPESLKTFVNPSSWEIPQGCGHNKPTTVPFSYTTIDTPTAKD